MQTTRLADRAKAYALSIVPENPNLSAGDTNRFFEDLARIMIAGLAAFYLMETQRVRRSLSTPYGDFQRFCLSVGERMAGYDAASADVIRPLVSLGKMDQGTFICTQNAAWHLFVSAETVGK
jgi:hypothetical protein